MPQRILDIAIERAKPLHDLASAVTRFEGAAARGIRGREEEIEKLASAIRDSARALKTVYARGDGLPQLLEVIARTFEEPNRSQTYARATKYIINVILQAVHMTDITLVYVNGVVRELEKKGVKADYI